MDAAAEVHEPADLERRFAAGELDAFETLFRRHQAEVFGWIVRILRDASLAEDATIETFWRIYRARARFDARHEFGAWARRIATNVAIDFLKARSREVAGLDATDVPVAPGPIRDRSLSDAIRAAFRQLPAKLQAAASLALIEEESNVEIAAALGISVAAAKSRIHRSIGMLRKSLRRLQVTP
ncbi:MAG: RNA polymerase sigma factor [Bryobacteraceae bacterium]|jgi:RNA polymerase sigma-70 factor (ECF subfamily)